MNLNKVLLIGNLTRDPELRALPSGASLTTFSLATNRMWNDKEGKRQQSTDYHNVVVFGKQAENVSQYLKKGSSALVEGRIQSRSWDADDGTKRYKTEIVAEKVQFGPRNEGGGGYGGAATGAAGSGAAAGAEKPKKKDELETIEYPDEEEIDPDDIPF